MTAEDLPAEFGFQMFHGSRKRRPGYIHLFGRDIHAAAFYDSDQLFQLLDLHGIS
jgi:hypothetical protein